MPDPEPLRSPSEHVHLQGREVEQQRATNEHTVEGCYRFFCLGFIRKGHVPRTGNSSEDLHMCASAEGRMVPLFKNQPGHVMRPVIFGLSAALSLCWCVTGSYWTPVSRSDLWYEDVTFVSLNFLTLGTTPPPTSFQLPAARHVSTWLRMFCCARASATSPPIFCSLLSLNPTVAARLHPISCTFLIFSMFNVCISLLVTLVFDLPDRAAEI